MLRDFISKNNRSLLIIGILFGAWLLLYFFSGDKTEGYLNHPKVGQVYIFHEDDFYAPMRLDSITKDQLYMRNYLYLFSDAVPKRSQILNEEFDLNFYAIYERQEIKRLYADKRILKIYP